MRRINQRLLVLYFISGCFSATVMGNALAESQDPARKESQDPARKKAIRFRRPLRHTAADAFCHDNG